MSIDKSIRQYYDVPGTKKIEGQLHRLAYITAKEAKALKKMGGIETRTPEGIIAYPGHHGSSSPPSRSAPSGGSPGGGGGPPGGGGGPPGDGGGGGGGQTWSPSPAPKPAPVSISVPEFISKGPTSVTPTRDGPYNIHGVGEPKPVSISVPDFISKGPTSVTPTRDSPFNIRGVGEPKPVSISVPDPVDYSSLDNEEQAAVDRNEPTAQMTPKERNEQGHGPGGTTNPDYQRKQFEDTGDYDVFTDLTGFDDSPKVDVADIHGEWDDPSSVSYDMKYDPVTQAAATRKAIAEYKTPFFDTGIGKFIKGAGTILAPQLLSTFAPKEVVTGLQWAKRVKDFKEGKGIWRYAGKKLGLDEKLSNLKSNIKPTFDKDSLLGTSDWQGEQKRKKTFHQGEGGDGGNIQTAITGDKGLLTKGAETLGITDEQREQYLLMQNKMKTALDQGSYTNQQGQVIQLNEQQLDQLQKYINNLNNILGTVLQTAAHGGRIDGPLMGRSRYI